MVDLVVVVKSIMERSMAPRDPKPPWRSMELGRRDRVPLGEGMLQWGWNEAERGLGGVVA